ncbi:trypsin-like peptidase domain-containing protein [Shimia sp. R9_1]|nr:trypsin-like peptidase domain-containing protein [Shimia sp. R9_1]
MSLRPEDLGPPNLLEVMARFEEVRPRFEKAQKRIAAGRGWEAETTTRLLEAAQWEAGHAAGTSVSHMKAGPAFGLQGYVGPRDNILGAEFLDHGVLAARAVCKIVRGVEVGTGFLVGEGVVLTNHHVISGPTQAKQVSFEFLFDDNTIGQPRNSETYTADPDGLVFADGDLDMCFVSLKEYDSAPPLRDFGWLPLLRKTGKIVIGEPVNVIHHPRGEAKKVVVHDSVFRFVEDREAEGTDATDPFCWYSSDTEKGSSGAPVLNSRWEVVALHHKAIPDTDKNGFVLDTEGRRIAKDRRDDPERQVRYIANQGTRVSRIVERLEQAEGLNAKAHQIRQALLDLWSLPNAARFARNATCKAMPLL